MASYTLTLLKKIAARPRGEGLFIAKGACENLSVAKMKFRSSARPDLRITPSPARGGRAGAPGGPRVGGTGAFVCYPGLSMIQLYTGTDYPCHHTRRKGEALPQAHYKTPSLGPSLALGPAFDPWWCLGGI